MKYTIILILVLISVSLNTLTTPSSLAFSDSYLMRSSGIESIYWNPARIGENLLGNEMTFFATVFGMSNNGISGNTYNQVNGKYLSDADKHDLIKDLKGHLDFEVNTKTILFAYTKRNFGMSIGSNAAIRGKLSEDYLNLIFFGNEYDRSYNFNEANCNLYFLSFVDFTLGFGNYSLFDVFPSLAQSSIPEIKYGFNVSLLAGSVTAETSKFEGIFKCSDAGMELNQNVNLDYGVAGLGGRAAFGLSSEVYKNLYAGLTVDNILGMINWFGQTKRQNYHVFADSIYISQLGDKFYTSENSKEDIDAFTTNIPMELRLGLLYKYKDLSWSIDAKQASESSALTSKYARLSTGVEYQGFGIFPIRMGIALKTKETPLAVSYGLGFNTKRWESGMGVQLTDAFLPINTKGLAFSLFSKLRF